MFENGENEIFITGIDINRNFIENFIVALKNRTHEPDEPVFYFKPRKVLFHNIKVNELEVDNKKNALICLGGTIGNFLYQDSLFAMFSDHAKKDDVLILGFQLKDNIKWIVDKYKNNPLFPDFILNYVESEKRKKIEWTVNQDNGVITAIHDNVEVFRTTKYRSEELKNVVENHGFKFIIEDKDEYNNSCLHLYIKE